MELPKFLGRSLVHARRALTARGGCIGFLSGFPRSQWLVMGLHLNVWRWPPPLLLKRMTSMRHQLGISCLRKLVLGI
ncbi:unnamed protein product [Prunus armeniaca]